MSKGTKKYSNFQNMLKKSAPYVMHLIDHLQSKGIKCWENHDKKYDVITNKGTTYEVKVDGNAFIYGRTGVETQSFGKEAGVNASTADYYVIYYPILNYILVVRTDAIRILIKNYQHSTYKCGDERATWMALWNFKFFLTQLNNISKQNNYAYQLLQVPDEKMPKYIDHGVYTYLVNKYRTTRNSIFHKLRVHDDFDLQKFYKFVNKQITKQNLWPKNYYINFKQQFEYEQYK